MPKAQDPTQVEAAEVAEKATGAAAATGPSQADVAASEVFGEDTQEDTSPLARLKKKKAGLDQRVDERQKKEDEELRRAWLEQARLKKEAEEKARQEKETKEQMANLGSALSRAAKLQIITSIGECADEMDEKNLMDKVVNCLEGINAFGDKNAKEEYAGKWITVDEKLNQDFNSIFLALGKVSQLPAILKSLRAKGVDFSDFLPQIEKEADQYEESAQYYSGKARDAIFSQTQHEEDAAKNRERGDSLRRLARTIKAIKQEV